MIIGIEGTGSQTWGMIDLQRSFVRKILAQTTESPARYFIGPGDRGSEGETIITEVLAYIAKNARHSSRLVLVGYSRGAAYCLEVCKRWKRPVDVLVMFDAVARQPGMEVPQKVPENVRLCLHAYRDPRGGSRIGFGNVGQHVDTPGKTTFRHTMAIGSHGAMGGVYWDAAAGESGASGAAIKLMDWYNGDDVDRNTLGLPKSAQTGLAHDLGAMRKIGDWTWKELRKINLIPDSRDARYDCLAPVFDGGRVPGVAYFVRG